MFITRKPGIRGASSTEYILIVLLVAIGLIAAVTLYGRVVRAKLVAATESLDKGKAERGKTVFDLRGGTGIPGYMPSANNAIPTDPNAPPVPLYGNVPGKPLNAPSPEDFYVNPLGPGTSLTAITGPLDQAHLPPTLTVPRGMAQDFRQMARNSAADPAGREQFTWIVRNPATGETRLIGREFLGTNNGGAPTAPAPPAGFSVVGFMHTHPNAPQGEFTAPHSSPDINFQFGTPGGVASFVQSGDDLFALVTTNNTDLTQGANAASYWDTQYAAYLAAGHNIRDARLLALKDTANRYNLALYRGDSSGRLVLSN